MRSHTDICLILEGSYPYIRGGVSTWTDDLIRMHTDYTFHVAAVMAKEDDAEQRYDLPSNVNGLSTLFLQETHTGVAPPAGTLRELKPFLQNIMDGTATLEDISSILSVLGARRANFGTDYFLNSREAWEILTEMYEEHYDEMSILDYFWSWRSIVGNLIAVVTFNIPKADLYHCMSTGYAGLLAARIKVETGKPVFLTEHGIYTNERRIEIVSADWLMQTIPHHYTIDLLGINLRDMWMNTFSNYSRICYEASDRIITLYEGNQFVQKFDGAAPEKMMIIPNGIEVDRFSDVTHQKNESPTIALIGRVVPIKDIKTFIRTCALLNDRLPELKVFIMGPREEDMNYYRECVDLVEHFNLQDVVGFTGLVKIEDYFPRLDVVVLTSISEAQPLVILEAGAAGIPVVATNVGACGEMLNGSARETEIIAASGMITPVANPSATAAAILKLLADDVLYSECSEAAKARVTRYYNKIDQQAAYQRLYDLALNKSAAA